MDLITRNKFWIGVGLLVLVAGVAFGVFFVPVRAGNTRRAAEIRRKAQSVAEYKDKSGIVNQRWIEQAERSVEEWQEEIRQIGRKLETQDSAIEQLFKDPDNPGREDALEAGMWKMVYRENIRSLRETGRRAFKVFGDQALVTTEYGDEWPPSEEMRREEKKYWVQKLIVEALAGLNRESGRPVVPVFDSFSFVQEPERLLHPSHNNIFKPVPFEIRLASTFPNVPLVVHALLNSEANCQITSIQVERSDRAGERRNVAQAQHLEVEAPEMQEPEEPRRARRTSAPPPIAPDAQQAGPPAWLTEEMLMGEQGPPPEVTGQRQREREPSRQPRARRPSTRQQRAEPAEEVELPANLVDVTLKGYVLDYVEQQTQGQQSANQ
ncbi:MAG: hypothetical protein R6X33_07730 [Candidatus Brocadiia bacterium]